MKREDEVDVVQDEIEDEMIFLGMRPKVGFTWPMRQWILHHLDSTVYA